MTPQDLAKEEVPSNVIYMAEFLMKRRNSIIANANTFYSKAEKLSKKSNPREDPFACVLMKKADDLAEQVNDIEKHIKFIVRGGLKGLISIPSNGYSLTPPHQPVKISVTLPEIE